MTTDPDGLALMLILGVIGLVLLLAAAVIERLVEPRHERTQRHMASVGRAREQRRRELRAVRGPDDVQ